MSAEAALGTVWNGVAWNCGHCIEHYECILIVKNQFYIHNVSI